MRSDILPTLHVDRFQGSGRPVVRQRAREPFYDMRVPVERQLHRGVPETLGLDLRMDPGAERQGRSGRV